MEETGRRPQETQGGPLRQGNRRSSRLRPECRCRLRIDRTGAGAAELRALRAAIGWTWPKDADPATHSTTRSSSSATTALRFGKASGPRSTARHACPARTPASTTRPWSGRCVRWGTSDGGAARAGRIEIHTGQRDETLDAPCGVHSRRSCFEADNDQANIATSGGLPPTTEKRGKVTAIDDPTAIEIAKRPRQSPTPQQRRKVRRIDRT